MLHVQLIESASADVSLPREICEQPTLAIWDSLPLAADEGFQRQLLNGVVPDHWPESA